MNRYRAVIQVPTVIKFDCIGDEKLITEHVNEIAAGMGIVETAHPRQLGTVYPCNVLECVRVEGSESNTVTLGDLTAPGAA